MQCLAYTSAFSWHPELLSIYRRSNDKVAALDHAPVEDEILESDWVSNWLAGGRALFDILSNVQSFTQQLQTVAYGGRNSYGTNPFKINSIAVRISYDKRTIVFYSGNHLP